MLLSGNEITLLRDLTPGPFPAREGGALVDFLSLPPELGFRTSL